MSDQPGVTDTRDDSRAAIAYALPRYGVLGLLTADQLAPLRQYFRDLSEAIATLPPDFIPYLRRAQHDNAAHPYRLRRHWGPARLAARRARLEDQ